MSNSGQKPVFQPQQDAFANHVEGLRSFAETYAKSTLSRDRSMAGATRLIRKIDMMVDREIDLIHDATEALANEGKGLHFACKKGCAHCCHQVVAAAVPEVLHAAAAIKESHTAADLVALKKRLAEYVTAKREVEADKRADFVHPCPLLIDNVCSGFEVRPLACRGFNSFDVTTCIQFKDSPGKVMVLGSKKQVAVYEALQTGLRSGLTEVEAQGDLVAYAEALQIALEHEDAASRYFDGEPIFESAKIT